MYFICLVLVLSVCLYPGTVCERTYGICASCPFDNFMTVWYVRDMKSFYKNMARACENDGLVTRRLALLL